MIRELRLSFFVGYNYEFINLSQLRGYTVGSGGRIKLIGFRCGRKILQIIFLSGGEVLYLLHNQKPKRHE